MGTLSACWFASDSLISDRNSGNIYKYIIILFKIINLVLINNSVTTEKTSENNKMSLNIYPFNIACLIHMTLSNIQYLSVTMSLSMKLLKFLSFDS